MNNQGSNENKRLLFAVIIALLLGISTGYGWQFLVGTLSLYALWMLNKLFELDAWLSNGRDSNKIPYVDGLWGRIVNHILRLNKELDYQKKRYQKLIIRFNKILHTFPYPTLIINQHQEITWVSKTAAKMLRLNRKQDIGLRIGHIIRYGQFQTLLNDPKNSEFQLKSPSNSKIVLVISISPLNKDTRVLSIRDISQRKQLEQLKNTFITNASHELRTPLTVVNDHLELLNNSQTLTPADKSMVQKSYEQSQKMAKLIQDLLQFSQLENHHYEQKFTLINMANRINKVLKYLEQNSIHPPIFNCHIEQTLLIKGIESQLDSLLFNLLENAVKYNIDNHPIDIKWTPHKQKGILMISNQNKIITQTQLTKMSEPFYRINTTQSISGTGLGLSIVQQVAKNHQAELDFIQDGNKKIPILLVSVAFPI